MANYKEIYRQFIRVLIPCIPVIQASCRVQYLVVCHGLFYPSLLSFPVHNHSDINRFLFKALTASMDCNCTETNCSLYSSYNFMSGVSGICLLLVGLYPQD
jgi:hypothetical protein